MKLSLQYRKQFKVALPWILWATFLMEDFTTVLNLEACLKHSEASFFSAKSNCASFSSNMTLDQQKSYCKQSKILGLCLLARRYKRLQEKAIYFVLSSFSRESHSSENYHTNWRPSCKKGGYLILADFHFLVDQAKFWQTDLFWHEKHRSVIVSVDLRFVLQK